MKQDDRKPRYIDNEALDRAIGAAAIAPGAPAAQVGLKATGNEVAIESLEIRAMPRKP